jgi:hypothetical protein
MSQRLRALLEMRQLDPAGRRFPATAYVFGSETGERVKSVKTAWETARLKAYGYQVTREKTGRLTRGGSEEIGETGLVGTVEAVTWWALQDSNL